MSTATMSQFSASSTLNLPAHLTYQPRMPHTPHAPHPIPLREQAFALHCQGLRSPAISAELGVPERTIRAWIAAALDELKDDLQLNRKEQLLLAVERQHQLTATAWQQFNHEAAARAALLDATLDTLLNAADATNTASDASSSSASASTRFIHLHLPASTPAPRYLNLILQANKETNRLLGLHTLAKLHLLTADTPDTPDTSDTLASEPAPLTDSIIPAESATASKSNETAETDIPAKTATDTPAKTAITPNSPCTVVQAPSVAGVWGQGSHRSVSPVETERSESGGGTTRRTRQEKDGLRCLRVEPRNPAKTATATSTPRVAAGYQPAKRHSPKRPQPWMM